MKTPTFTSVSDYINRLGDIIAVVLFGALMYLVFAAA